MIYVSAKFNGKTNLFEFAFINFVLTFLVFVFIIFFSLLKKYFINATTCPDYQLNTLMIKRKDNKSNTFFDNTKYASV
jgi:hypothetical protein